MYAIANKYDGFIQIHSQQNDSFTTDILKLSADFPNSITVLSHCLPASQPNNLANLFAQRKNIVCEMSATGSAHNKILGINRPARSGPANLNSTISGNSGYKAGSKAVWEQGVSNGEEEGIGTTHTPYP